MTEELRRIVLVEDEPDIQEVARLALEMVGGFEVTICGSGPEALDVIARDTPQLVLLDVMLPGMDGPQILAQLRQRPEGAALPVIFMTAKVQPGDVKRLSDLGPLDVIAKPFDPLTLAGTIRAIWEGRA
ncbi:response regulator [Marinivivus vitaminiproducens]|uniref:response regulator n=1 Tax=Marinivivus vitaminiproducens TaxID=3035935 RepID=UPI00279DEF10|nr:response regulator [Geminicoccaceae bacterium SCSIO 64248]